MAVRRVRFRQQRRCTRLGRARVSPRNELVRINRITCVKYARCDVYDVNEPRAHSLRLCSVLCRYVCGLFLVTGTTLRVSAAFLVQVHRMSPSSFGVSVRVCLRTRVAHGCRCPLTLVKRVFREVNDVLYDSRIALALVLPA